MENSPFEILKGNEMFALPRYMQITGSLRHTTPGHSQLRPPRHVTRCKTVELLSECHVIPALVPDGL